MTAVIAPLSDDMLADTDPSQQPDPNGPDLREALATLHTRSCDVLEGLDTMRDRATAEIEPVVARFVALHSAQVETLSTLLAEAGGDPDAGGSLMGAVNRIVVSLRSLFDEIDADSMEALRDGEQHVLDAYDTAIAAEQTPAHRARLVEMHGELQTLIDATRHIG